PPLSAKTPTAVPSRIPPAAVGALSLREILEGIEGVAIDPALTYDGPITPSAAGAYAARMERIHGVSLKVVINAGQPAVAFQQNAEREQAARLDDIRAGRIQFCQPEGHQFGLDECTRLVAHHRLEAERIQAQIDALAQHPMTAE